MLKDRVRTRPCALVLCLGFAVLSGCKSPDLGEPARLAAERAEQLQTTEAYQAFLDTRPDPGLYAGQIERARTAIDAETRARLMALDLAGQVDYLRDSKNQFAREELLAAVIARMEGRARVEQIQWMFDLGWSCQGAGTENAEAMRRILAPPDKFLRDREVPATGPATLDPIERTYLALEIAELRNPSEEAREVGLGYLLAISTDRSDLRWTVGNQRWVPADQGTPTSPRENAINALAKFADPLDVALLALEAGTLSGDRAWSIVQEWLEPSSTYEHKLSVFSILMRSENRDLGEQFLPLAEQLLHDSRLPALLECVRRRVPNVEDRIEPWLAGEDPDEQAAAAYAIALYDLETAQFDARLDELLTSDARTVRSAALLAKYGMSSLEQVRAGMDADPRGAASFDPFREQLERGFVMSTNTSFVDLSAPLPDLDYTETSPLRTTQNWPFMGTRYTRGESLAELRKTYALLQRAQAAQARGSMQAEGNTHRVQDSMIQTVTTLAVLDRERELFIDPEVEGRWLLWPRVYLCYVDPRSEVVLGTHWGSWGERILPVPNDVARVVRQIVDSTATEPGVEGGIVAVAEPGYLRLSGGSALSRIRRAQAQLLSAVAAIDGRRHAGAETRWSYVIRSPINDNVDPIYGSSHPLCVMATELDDSCFRSDLVFAQVAGRVTEIVDSPTGPPEEVGLRVAIDGETAVEGLSLLGVEVGDTVTRGQWIGLRWHRR